MVVLQANFKDFWAFLTPPADFLGQFFPRELILDVRLAYFAKKRYVRTYNAHTTDYLMNRVRICFRDCQRTSGGAWKGSNELYCKYITL